MHNDLFSIFGLTVHGYGLMIGLGVVCSLLLSWRRAPQRGFSDDTASTITILAVVCGFAGAKLLYMITNWDQLMADPKSIIGSEGFVVYGGLLFGFLSSWLYTRHRKESFFRWADVLLPGVAVAQGLGRIGCFLAGCCYGKPTGSPLGVVFPVGSMAIAGVPLWPTQLFSSAGDLLLAGALLYVDRREHADGTLAVWYLLLYGIGRFCIEFLRGDPRGSVGALSTSQFLSIFCLAAAGVLALVIRERNKKA